MNDFEKKFIFTKYEFNRYKCTDMSDGTDRNFVAKIIEGRAKFVKENGEFMEVEAGEAFFLPKGCKYHSYWYGEARVSFYSFGFLDMPIEEKTYIPMQKINTTDKILQMFEKIKLNGPIDCENIGNFYFLMNEVMKNINKSECEKNKIIIATEKLLNENPDLTGKNIADKLKISESTFYSAIRKADGDSFTEMKQKAMVKKAEKLLQNTDLSVEEISFQAGFSSSSYFRRIFKKINGTSPKKMRNKFVI